MPNVSIPHCFPGQNPVKLGDRLPVLCAWEEDKATDFFYVEIQDDTFADAATQRHRSVMSHPLC
jgi:hypothetical protein